MLYMWILYSRHKKVSYINYKFTSIFHSLFEHLKEYMNYENKITNKSLPKKNIYKVSTRLKL